MRSASAPVHADEEGFASGFVRKWFFYPKRFRKLFGFVFSQKFNVKSWFIKLMFVLNNVL